MLFIGSGIDEDVFHDASAGREIVKYLRDTASAGREIVKYLRHTATVVVAGMGHCER